MVSRFARRGGKCFFVPDEKSATEKAKAPDYGEQERGGDRLFSKVSRVTESLLVQTAMVGMDWSEPFNAQRGSRIHPVVGRMQAMRREGTVAAPEFTASAR